MKKLTTLIVILTTALILQGCVHKLITVPVKIAYKATKGVVKGTVAVAKAVIPDSDEKKD